MIETGTSGDGKVIRTPMRVAAETCESRMSPTPRIWPTPEPSGSVGLSQRRKLSGKQWGRDVTLEETPMKRVTLFGAMSALLLAMMIPAAASAALPKWWDDINRAACTHTGGLYGFGKVVLNVDFHSFNDWGNTTTPTPNYIKVNILRQEKVNGA